MGRRGGGSWSRETWRLEMRFMRRGNVEVMGSDLLSLFLWNEGVAQRA